MTTLALDLGGTSVSVRFTTDREIVNQTLRLPVSDTYSQDILLIKDVIHKIKGNRKIAGAAISSAATIDLKGMVARWPNRPHWEGFPLKNDLEELINCPVVLEDDGNAAAIADAAILGVNDLIYIGIGTGISGGLVLGGEIYRGFRNKATEIGHMVIYPDGPKCTCYRNGCLQAYASGKAIMSALFPETQEVTDSDFRAAFDSGSKQAVKAFDTAANMLASAIISLCEILDPKVFSIGGGIGINFPELIEKIIHRASKCLRKGQTLPRILPSANSVWASLEGADILAKKSAQENLLNQYQF